jgi:hypothetical protein
VSDYRPITDVMILARSKTKYYGAFPAGFLHRGRQLLGVSWYDPVLFVCGGRVRDYPFKGLRGMGPNDKTVDLDASLNPDFVMDVRTELPKGPWGGWWAGIIVDRPYTPEDADKYAVGRDVLPNLNELTRRSLALVPEGHRVGVLDYLWPHPGQHGQEVAACLVTTGRNSRARTYVVFERKRQIDLAVRVNGLGKAAAAGRRSAGLVQSFGSDAGAAGDGGPDGGGVPVSEVPGLDADVGADAGGAGEGGPAAE